MAWFQVDDTLCFHPKALAAKNAAMGLWVRAGSWSMQNLTEGAVTNEVARMLGSAAEITRLVDVGLWVPDNGGFAFHQWETRQQSKEQVQKRQKAARDRQRRAREKATRDREDAEALADSINGHVVTIHQVHP